MEEVEYHVLEMWGWECPKCKRWHETSEDPGYEETLTCENNLCGKEFIPVPG